MLSKRILAILREAPAVRFILIMYAALIVGIVVNWLWQEAYGYRTFKEGFGFLFAIYAILVLITGSVAAILSKILSRFTHKGLVYISFAAAGLILSFVAFPPHEYGGFHIIIDAWFGLLLVAIDRYLAARGSSLGEPAGSDQSR